MMSSSSAFGKEFKQNWPVIDFVKNLTKNGRELLENCVYVEKPTANKIDVEKFIEKSNEFPLEFPIDSCRVKAQPVERHAIIQQQIESAYPLIHEKVLYLIIEFLQYKLQYGSSRERKLYQNMGITDFIQRLLTKRCVSFVGFSDYYILITGKTGLGDQYLKIGSDEEAEPLVLENVLSYDEVKIAALLTITSCSEFINDGRRKNRGVPEQDLSKIERQGVVVGLIGARFARPDYMEYQDICISKTQNTSANGYGCKSPTRSPGLWETLNPFNKPDKLKQLQEYRRVWNSFYEEHDYLYEQVIKDNLRFGTFAFKTDIIFDNFVMKKRFAISFDLLLLEAEKRALKAGKFAYIHVVGIGLGVWLGAQQQEQIFMETFYLRLKYLLPLLNHIGVVHLSWFHMTECGDLKNEGVLKSEYHPRGGIKTLISKRNPNEKLTGPYEDMLTVVSFAWDGNALAGNEFWDGSLESSNDPSAACSTLITELHNPHINTDYVNGQNLHIASARYGIIHIKDYAEAILAQL